MPLFDHFHPPAVTRRQWESFHSLWCAALLEQLNELLPPPYFGAVQVHTVLYAAAYRPVRREGQNLIDNWLAPLSVGQPLPVVPLPVRGVGCLRLDLEVGYSHARQSSRL